MAYYGQARKKTVAPKIRALCAEFGVKGTLSVKHHSSVTLTIKSGVLDFGQADYNGYVDVNVYYIDEHFAGKERDFLTRAYRILMAGNHNNSDIQTDYFDVGWYVSIHVGKWDAPYIHTKKVTQPG